MDLQEFTSILEQRDCVSYGKEFCGVYMEVPFAVAFVHGRKDGTATFALRIQFTASTSNKVAKDLNARIKGYARVQKIAAAKNLCNFTVTTKKGQPFEVIFDKLFAELYALITQYGLHIPTACDICNLPNCDSYAFIHQAYRQVHADCVHAHSTDAKAKVAQNEESGSYVLGAVGALAGGLIGIIPSLFLAYFLNLISAWFCALIPIGAYYGYKILRGKMGKGVLVILGIVALLMAPVTEYLIQLCLFVKEGYGAISPIEYLEIVKAFPGETLPNFGQTLLFIALGYAFSYGIISRGNAFTSSQASYSVASLRPIYQESGANSAEDATQMTDPTEV